MNRRGFLTGLVSSLVAAPAVVSAASLMPIRGIVMPFNLTATEIVNRALDVYGRSPAMEALDELRNWEASVRYHLGARVWVFPDDGSQPEFDLSPGAINRGPPGAYLMECGGSFGLGR